jgi:hypothetical protein
MSARTSSPPERLRDEGFERLGLDALVRALSAPLDEHHRKLRRARDLLDRIRRLEPENLSHLLEGEQLAQNHRPLPDSGLLASPPEAQLPLGTLSRWT